MPMSLDLNINVESVTILAEGKYFNQLNPSKEAYM
jgi:hypothetical protein